MYKNFSGSRKKKVIFKVQNAFYKNHSFERRQQFELQRFVSIRSGYWNYGIKRKDS